MYLVLPGFPRAFTGPALGNGAWCCEQKKKKKNEKKKKRQTRADEKSNKNHSRPRRPAPSFGAGRRPATPAVRAALHHPLFTPLAPRFIKRFLFALASSPPLRVVAACTRETHSPLNGSLHFFLFARPHFLRPPV